MHVTTHGDGAPESDSMKIFRMGLEGGKPGSRQDRRPAGMVLQGCRHLRSGAGRRRAPAGLCPGRGRGSRNRRPLSWSARTASPSASAMRSATSSPIISPRRRTISTPSIPSCAPARSGRNCWSGSCRRTSAASRASCRDGKVIWEEDFLSGEEHVAFGRQSGTLSFPLFACSGGREISMPISSVRRS